MRIDVFDVVEFGNRPVRTEHAVLGEVHRILGAQTIEHCQLFVLLEPVAVARVDLVEGYVGGVGVLRNAPLVARFSVGDLTVEVGLLWSFGHLWVRLVSKK